MNEPRKLALKVVTDAIVELNDTFEEPVDLSQGDAAPLYGQDGVLDSLALVSLIVLIEEKAHDTFGRPVTLADDRAMSQFRSPFRNIGSLTDYVVTLAA